MQTSHSQSRWWDWTSLALLLVLLHTVASRLVTTGWTSHLNFAQTFTSMGFVIGVALGYSHFQRRSARWLSFAYMLITLPLIWTRVIDQQVELDERLLSVGGRLLYSLSEFFARRPVEDPLFFVALMSITFWILSASAGFYLVRHQNYLAVVLPSAIGILIIQHYDNIIPGRVWFLGFFIFIALCLLGRLNFLQNKTYWRKKRIFLSPENSVDLTSSMTIVAGLIIISAWTLPLSISRVDTFRKAWDNVTKPWTSFTDRMQNAVSALKGPSRETPVEFYSTALKLGNGFPLSDAVMFTVTVPDVPFADRPPRYYWQGRTYDYYAGGQWYMTDTSRITYSPLEENIAVPFSDKGVRARFVFDLNNLKFSLIYAPEQPVWFSRPGSYLNTAAGNANDIRSWNAIPTLLPGETYQVDAIVSGPTIEDLRAAGTDYPQWITDKYLQLPDKFSSKIQSLAKEIAGGAETPYDKAFAVTNYLRSNIAYEKTIPDPPRNTDPVEWVLFKYKKAYCVYYASSEVLMLRSLGIPARMAVGFSQGTSASPSQPAAGVPEEAGVTTKYTVRQNNAHAWPEVFFPGIGWVEFEPTGNQAPLNRPLTLNPANNVNGSGLARNPLAESDVNIPDNGSSRANSLNQAQQTQRVPLAFYLLPTIAALAALTIYLGRRYKVPAHVPGFVHTTMERSGVEVPNWVLRWEHWSALSSIERSFESINFGLRWIKQPAPVHATPVERAKNLANALPQLEDQIKVLLDEHQTSLYTLKEADEGKARRVAFQIKTQVITSLIRHFWTGHYESVIAKPET